MTAEAAAIQQVMPSDNDLRMGIVSSISPLKVDFQGQDIICGKLASYVPVVGDTVAVMRQDATWLALGTTSQTVGKQLSQDYYVQSTAILPLTTTITDVPNCTVSFSIGSGNATIVVQWTCDFESTGTTSTVGVSSLWLDGTQISGAPQALYGTGGVNGVRGTVGNQYLFSPLTGNHTLTLRAARATGADSMLRINSVHTSLLIQIYE